MVWLDAAAQHYHMHIACLARELQRPVLMAGESAQWIAEEEARRAGRRPCPYCYGSRGRTA